MLSNSWIEEAGVRSETMSSVPTTVAENETVRSRLVPSSYEICAFRKKRQDFRPDALIALVDGKPFKAYRIAHQPTKYTRTPLSGVEQLRC